MAAAAQAPLLFYDLSLLPDSSPSRLQLLATTARALELGYAAVALDHPHRGLLADSHRCATQPFPPLSSLPLPSPAALHRRRLASPVTEPFRQYTRITLSLDSAAAAASALAPSAARLLRTYDLVATRPLTQAAFDHLCQAPVSAHNLDLISIDFSSHTKLPFRIKLPMLKLALQKGLHFEIAYSPLLSTDTNAKRNLLAQLKLLVAWTKGKNLIISSAAHAATQIRGPYDVINLSAYLLGLPINRAKAAISANCRSLISKALRKKHFYKETIRIDRLLPNEQLSSTKFKLADWIGWNSIMSKEDLQPLGPGPSSNSGERPGSPSPIYGVVEGSHERPHNSDVSVFAKQSEQSSDDQEQIPSQAREDSLQVDSTEVLIDCGQSELPSSFNRQSDFHEKARSSEVVLDHFVQAHEGSSVDLKSIENRVEFIQDAMEVDATESCRLNLIAGDNIPSTSDTGIKLACSALPYGSEFSVTTSLENQSHDQSSDFLDNAKSYIKYHTDRASSEREKTLLGLNIHSGSDVCPEDKISTNDMLIDTEAHRGIGEPVECPPGGVDFEAPLDLAFYSGQKLCRDVMVHQKVIEGKVDQSMVGSIEQSLKNEAESADTNKGTTVSLEPTFHGQEISSTSSKRSTDTCCESSELIEQNSEETSISLEKSVAKTHEPLLNFSCPNGKVEMSTTKSEKWRRKLRPYQPTYLPFLGFLRSVHFKKKLCKVLETMVAIKDLNPQVHLEEDVRQNQILFFISCHQATTMRSLISLHVAFKRNS